MFTYVNQGSPYGTEIVPFCQVGRARTRPLGIFRRCGSTALVHRDLARPAYSEKQPLSSACRSDDTRVRRTLAGYRALSFGTGAEGPRAACGKTAAARRSAHARIAAPKRAAE